MSTLRADSKTNAAKPATSPRGDGARDEARATQDRTAQRTPPKDPVDGFDHYNLPFTD